MTGKGLKEGTAGVICKVLFLDLDGNYEDVHLIIMYSSYTFILVLCIHFNLKYNFLKSTYIGRLKVTHWPGYPGH